MNFGGPGFVLAIIAMSMLAWVITTSIRARHGYPSTKFAASNEILNSNEQYRSTSEGAMRALDVE